MKVNGFQKLFVYYEVFIMKCSNNKQFFKINNFKGKKIGVKKIWIFIKLRGGIRCNERCQYFLLIGYFCGVFFFVIGKIKILEYNLLINKSLIIIM